MNSQKLIDSAVSFLQENNIIKKQQTNPILTIWQNDNHYSYDYLQWQVRLKNIKELDFINYLKTENTPESLCILGYKYDVGSGVNKDKKLALKYYKESIARDDACALYHLGYYQQERGDYKNAFKNFNICILLNDRMYGAYYKIGECYHRGYGVEKDMKKAQYYYVRGGKMIGYTVRKIYKNIDEQIKDCILYYANIANNKFELEKNPKRYQKYIPRLEKLYPASYEFIFVKEMENRRINYGGYYFIRTDTLELRTRFPKFREWYGKYQNNYTIL